MPEIVYRMVALVLGVTYMTIRSVYERKLGRPAKLSQLKEASANDRNELLVVSFATMLMWAYMLSTWLDFAAMGLPGPLRWAGAVLAAAGVAMFVWSHSALAGNWTPFVQTPPAGTLITSGPYRWIRHPMYSSFFLCNGGMWLLTSNWLAGGVPFLAFLWMYLARVDREERIMHDLFGEKYAVYAEKTGRVVPGIGHGLKSE